MRRFATLAGLLAIGLLLLGAGGEHRSSPSSVPLRVTPRALLRLCLSNSLLRSVCPRQIPASGSGPAARPSYYCMTRNPRETVRQTFKLFGTSRCVFAEWSYEAGNGLPGLTPSTRLTGWNGRVWVADEYSMLPPPLHAGVDIQAASRSAPQGVNAAPIDRPHGLARVSDALLGPSGRAVSLGWVTWNGRNGQLVLTPYGTCETGNELIFYIPPDGHGISYSIRLDAWMGTVHLSGRRIDRIQTGPSLPRVIATLKAIVGSAFTQRGTGGSRR